MVGRFAVLVFLLYCAACSEPVTHRGETLHTGLAKVQSLDVYAADGKLHVLVAGRVNDASVQTYYLYSTDGGRQWSEPVRAGIDVPPPHKPARNTDVQIAASGQRLVAAWQIAGDGWGGYGPMITVISDDGGSHWRPTFTPAVDSKSAEQGFIDLDADAGGNFHIVWLDTREEKRGLRYAQSRTAGENWSGTVTIDDHTCECCWNRIKAIPGSLIVTYRDRDPRDMHLAVGKPAGNEWLRNTNAGNFGWQFDGCPHAGAGLAVRGPDGEGEKIHVTTWTGKTGQAGLYYIRSGDTGISWQKPYRLASARAKHSDIAVNNGHVTAVWQETGEQGTGIFYATSKNSGESFQPSMPLDCADPSTGSHPRIVSTGREYLVLWTTEKGNLCSVSAEL